MAIFLSIFRVEINVFTVIIGYQTKVKLKKFLNFMPALYLRKTESYNEFCIATRILQCNKECFCPNIALFCDIILTGAKSSRLLQKLSQI